MDKSASMAMAWAFSGRLEISSFRAFIDREETINKTNGDRHLMMCWIQWGWFKAIQGEKKDESVMINRCVRRRVDCFGFGLNFLPINYIRFSHLLN